jgi:twitching motility protein PilT
MAASSFSPADSTAAGTTLQHASLDSVLTTMLESMLGVSDCLFVVGRPPQVEAYGRLCPVDIPQFMPVLQPAHTKAVAERLMGESDRLRNDFRNSGSCDTSYAVPNIARFRVNIFRQNGNYAVVMRKLTNEVPSIDQLKLPQILKDVSREKNGIILVTGATGNGKTTSLAAILNEVNQVADVHIVTLEDPIEFLHTHKRATFSQRELGKDFLDFATGLRAALRQAPKIILVGEIRDRETMEIALTAAETGHTVYATLHTISASLSINRIIGFFSKDEEGYVRQRLADVLRYIISQRLMPKVGGGRILATEIMGSSLRTKEAVLLGESDLRDLHEIIESSHQFGWHSFEQCLIGYYRDQRITEDTAMAYSVNKPAMRKAIDIAKKEMTQQEEGLTGLRLNLTDLHIGPGQFAPISMPSEEKK